MNFGAPEPDNVLCEFYFAFLALKCSFLTFKHFNIYYPVSIYLKWYFLSSRSLKINLLSMWIWYVLIKITSTIWTWFTYSIQYRPFVSGILRWLSAPFWCTGKLTILYWLNKVSLQRLEKTRLSVKKKEKAQQLDRSC